jgi:transposase
MPENTSGAGAGKRRSKRFLSPSQKYEIWLQLVRQEVAVAEAGVQGVGDRSVPQRVR